MRVEAAPDPAEVTELRDAIAELIITPPFERCRDAVAAAHATELPTRTTNSRMKRKKAYDSEIHGDVPAKAEKTKKRQDSLKPV